MDRTRNTVNRLALLAGGCLLLAVGTAALAAHTAARRRTPRWWTDFSSRGRWLEPQAWATGRAHPAGAQASPPPWSWPLSPRRPCSSSSCAAAPSGSCPWTARPLPWKAAPSRVRSPPVSSRCRGVHSGRTTLHGTPVSPRLHTRLVVDDTASPRRLLTTLTASTVPEAREFLNARGLTAEVRITVRRTRGRKIG
ncbi:hypothetical protein OG898_29600 [Streptomyces sp. NBC_00193]|uniref:hypothetical protein n=1 Tax=Streptomyces sp. NBC_00193 TaxID=2975675 RepID=UPI00225AC9E4|nr:hypothetical protein [Streptomyces sp. NBC_00193]MCX5300571.1 hypothetical protein [Streptomyces sp. NBC_00193]